MTDTSPRPPANQKSTRGFWSGARIRQRLVTWAESGTPIISPAPEDKNIGRASVRLTVGEEIYVSPAAETDSKTRQLLKDRQSLIIPSGQYAFLCTAETVRIPNDAVAFITLRSKEAAFRGLVNVSGFHVDPGYIGQLIFSVFNAGPGPVQVTLGDPWFEIFFADLADPEDEEYDDKKGYSGIPTKLITPLAKQFHSFAGLENEIKETKDALSDRITAIEREHTVVRWAAVLVAGAIVTLALRSLWPNSPSGDAIRDKPSVTLEQPTSASVPPADRPSSQSAPPATTANAVPGAQPVLKKEDGQ